MPGLSCSFYRASPPTEDRKHCSGIDWLSACEVIALLILHWKYIFSPFCFERLMQWWEGAEWSINCCLCEDEYTDDVTLILALNDSVDHLTLTWGISHTFSEACTTKLQILRQGLWQHLGVMKMMKPWVLRGSEEEKKKEEWLTTLPKQFQHPWKKIYKIHLQVS